VLDRLTQRDAQVFGISIDSQFVQAAFAREAGITYPMLGDPNREASRAFQVLLEEPLVGIRDVSDRAIFVVDRSGTVRYAWMGNITGQPDAEAVVRAVESL
jgi:peroxiredoxin